MTYEEYTKVIDFLCIEFLLVVINFETEYESFKNLDLITNADEVFEDLDEFYEGIDHDLIDTHVLFWLNPKTYELNSFLILEERDDLVNNTIMQDRVNTPKRQIVLDYSTFVNLIS